MYRLVGVVVGVVVLGGCSPYGTLPATGRARLVHATEQSIAQQKRDILECTEWAQDQSAKASSVGGFFGWLGGTVTGAGTQGYGSGQEGADRAYTVCMNGRGYSVYWQ